MQGYNGKVGWTMDLARGPSLMTGDMLQQTKREADFNADLNAIGVLRRDQGHWHYRIQLAGLHRDDLQKR